MKYQLAAEEAKWNQELAEERAQVQALKSEQTRRQLLVTIGIAILTLISLLVAIYYLYRNNRLNKKLSHQREIISEELKLKEALLSEIHHRVKNNLQVVSSMLSLQTQYLSDNTLKQIIEDSKGRINSMSLIHESLYRKNDFKEALFSSYIENLIPRLIETYGTDENRIQLVMDLEPIKLSLDDSIPCGLIINEIVSNSLKHGFPNGKQGTISIELKQKEKLVFLTISDDGVGLEEGKTFSSNDSFGFLLISFFSFIGDQRAELEKKPEAELNKKKQKKTQRRTTEY
jgi:two-component sensor histidine kinase